MTRVLLIEDEEGLAEALIYQLERAGLEVTHESDGAQGLETFRRDGADLVLLDLMLPTMSGEDVCREIRSTTSVPIIMLTAKGEEIDKVVGLELGADDYVTKPFSTRELIARINAVLRRSTADVSPSQVLAGGNIRLDSDRFEVTVGGEPVRLPRKEFELLECLMSNPGRVLTRETLIDNVWGSDYFGDTRTLDVHVKRLRAKIEPDPKSPVHLLTIRGVGYKFVA